MKIGTRVSIVLLVLLVLAGTSFAAPQITQWLENKKGAVSVTFDDGLSSEYSLGVPALNERGFKGTFFICSDIVGEDGYADWDAWRNAANMGHEIGSHTKTHPHLTRIPLTEMQDEIAGSKVVIDSQITSQRCLTFAYPWGEVNSSVKSVTRNSYIAARGTECYINSAPYDFYDMGTYTPEDCYYTHTLQGMEAMTDTAEQQGNWFIVLFHSLDGTGFGDWPIGTVTQYLDYLKTKNLWVGTFGAVVKYIDERASATLSVISSSSDQIVLSLADTLDDAIYDQPLTIRSEVPSSWGYASVQQGSGITTVESAVEGSTRVIYFNAVPDRGLITLNNVTSTGTPQIMALDPQSITAGSAGFLLRVTGNYFITGSVVRWNGSDRVTTFVSPTQLQGAITAGDLAMPGTVPVTVFNPGGGSSNAISFDIMAANPLPSITSLSPASARAGGSDFSLNVTGTNFINGSVVRWNGFDRTTTYISATELTASIKAADIATPGTVSVTVYNPAPGGGTSNGVTFNITAPNTLLVSVGVNPSSVVGGNSSQGTVALNGPAPSEGVVVMISSSNTSVASIPANVTVPSGATSVTFEVTTIPVSSSTSVTISAIYGGVTKAAKLTVKPPAPSSLVLDPTSIASGNTSVGTLTLNGPAPSGGTVVTLTSTNTLVATVPASVMVPYNSTSTTFTVTTYPVTSSTSVTIRGSCNGVTKSDSLTVKPLLKAISLSPSSVVGGSLSTGTVTLNGPAPGDMLVLLSSSNPSVASVSDITVPSSATSFPFTVTTYPVPSSTSVTISAGSGGVIKTATLTVKPPALSSLVLVPKSVVGGNSSSGTVTLSGPAPSVGVVVTLTSGNTSVATVPANVIVSAGNTIADFTVTTSKVTAQKSPAISASYNGTTKKATLTVTP